METTPDNQIHSIQKCFISVTLKLFNFYNEQFTLLAKLIL